MALSLIPTEEKFFELFDEQAAHGAEAAEAFRSLIRGWDLASPLFERIRDIEHEADIVAHEIKDKLDRTFVTPLDREDIHELASELDDIADLVKVIANRMRLYRVQECRGEMLQMADILAQAVAMVQKSVACLPDAGRNATRLKDHCIEINRLENAGDRLLEAALGRLFDSPPDPVEVVKWEKIFELTEKAIDKCEDVAHTLESILVKQA